MDVYPCYILFCFPFYRLLLILHPKVVALVVLLLRPAWICWCQNSLSFLFFVAVTLLWQVSVMWYSPWCIKSIAMGLAATCTSSLVFLWWIWSTCFLPLLYASSIFSVFKVSVLYLTVTSVLLFCLFTPFSVSSLLKNQNINLLLE